MKVVRDSKYRHVFSEASKSTFLDVRPSTKSTESLGIRANGKWIACSWESGGGGAVAVFGMDKTGRIPRDLPLLCGHTGPISDFEFNPFDDNMLCTASEDLTVKIWSIPEEGPKAHMKEATATLEGHGKKVTFCTWNPNISHIVASTAFEPKLKIWNVAEQDCAFTMDLPEQVWHLKWNHMGSLLAVTTKDKKMRIVDPRQQKFAAESQVHTGSKALKLDWMGGHEGPADSNKIITTGFAAQAERQIGVWDLRKFGEENAEPLNMLVLDQGTGALFPFYDAGTGMAFFAGKGDANVRYFEMDVADPYIHFITQYSSSTPSKGFDFLPKRVMDTTKHEIMRMVQLQASAIIPIGFKVPRKSEAFQEDIFPDCAAGVPSMQAEQWVEGGECKPPTTMSMRPGEGKVARVAAAPTAVVTVKDLKKQLAEAQQRIADLEKENAELKEQLAAKS
jgi:coronin-1B/1C/6